MDKKKRLGFNPLATYLASSVSQDSVDVLSERSVSAEHAGKKERITIHLPVELIDKVKNIVYWEPGITLTSLAEEAFALVVKQKEEQRGGEYPERKERLLKSGRPVG